MWAAVGLDLLGCRRVSEARSRCATVVLSLRSRRETPVWKPY